VRHPAPPRHRTRHRPAEGHSPGEDVGSASVLGPVLLLVAIGLTGVLLDFSLAVLAADRLTELVNQAAEAATSAVDLRELDASGNIVLDRSLARSWVMDVVDANRTGLEVVRSVSVATRANEVCVDLAATAHLPLWLPGFGQDLRLHHSSTASAVATGASYPPLVKPWC
jgi:hypothetical protein